MRRSEIIKHVAVATLLFGCADSVDANQQGNEALGIERFVVEDTAQLTTVSGLDASGQTIATLDLVHGRFALTERFRDEHDTPEVIGRKLDIMAAGQKFVWETAGFTPVLGMPAHPASAWAIATLVEDPHVKSILTRWGIGWEPSTDVLAGEDANTTITWYGWDSQECESNECGATPKGTINMCGNANNADETQDYAVEPVEPRHVAGPSRHVLPQQRSITQ